MPRQVRTLQWKVWLKEVLTIAENNIKMATGSGGGGGGGGSVSKEICGTVRLPV